MKVEQVIIDKIEILENSRVNMKKSDLAQLMESINQHGLEQPIGVYPSNNGFVLIYGHRRLESCKKLGWKKIPAVIQEELELKDLLVLNSVENLQRENISPAELGRIADRLMEMDMTPAEISARLSIPKSTLDIALKCYKGLPEKMRKKVAFMSHASHKKNGMIPASIMHQLLRLKKRIKMTDDYFAEIVDVIKNKEFTFADIVTIEEIVKSGVSVKVAIKKSLEYKTYRLDVLVNIEEMAKRCEAAETQPINLLREIVYGKAKHVLKPEFIEKGE